MKKIFSLMAFVMLTLVVTAQNKTTSSANIVLDATTPLDPLPLGENKTVIGSLNTSTGAVAFEAVVNSFAFSNPKLQEHFIGDKWMNSAIFPKFLFKGKISNLSKINFTKDGSYTGTVSGELTIKDETKDLKVPVTFVVKNGKINATTNFTIKLSDYNISGVPIDAGKVAKEPKIKVAATF